MTALTTRAAVSGNKVELRLRCSGATCRGAIRLYEGSTLLATKSYAMFAGTTSSWGAYLDSKALLLLVGSRYHTVNATEEVTVTDGTTVQKQITLVGPAVTALTTRAAVSGNKVELKLHCSGATCQGTIWLYDGRHLARHEELWHGGGHHVHLDDVLEQRSHAPPGQGQVPHPQCHRDSHRERRPDRASTNNPGRLGPT